MPNGNSPLCNSNAKLPTLPAFLSQQRSFDLLLFGSLPFIRHNKRDQLGGYKNLAHILTATGSVHHKALQFSCTEKLSHRILSDWLSIEDEGDRETGKLA